MIDRTNLHVIRSPLWIEVALHYHYSPVDHPRLHLDVVKSIVLHMVQLGMLRITTEVEWRKYFGTSAPRAARPPTYWHGPALECYIEALRAVPLPRRSVSWTCEPETKG